VDCMLLATMSCQGQLVVARMRLRRGGGKLGCRPAERKGRGGRQNQGCGQGSKNCSQHVNGSGKLGQT